MIPLSDTIRVGWRLIRATPTRSTVVVAAMAAPIALATAAAAVGWKGWDGAVWGATGVVLAILTVAQASPEPLRATSAQAWSAAGGSPLRTRLPGRVAGVILAWSALAIGVAVGVVASLAAGRDTRWWGVVLASFPVAIVLAVVALAVRPADRRLIRRTPSRVLVVLLWALLMPWAVWACTSLAANIQSNFDAAIALSVMVPLATLVVVTVLGPLLRLGVRALGAVPRMRTIAVLASDRASRLVRTVIVGAMLVASVGTILGVSVAGRGDPYDAVGAEIAALPIVPPDVAVLAPTDSAAGPDEGDLAAARLVEDVQSLLPGTTVVPTTRVVLDSLTTIFGCSLAPPPVDCSAITVVEDPRLDSIPGLPQHPTSSTAIFSAESSGVEGLISRWEDGDALPTASWRDLEVDLTSLESAGGGSFITGPGPIYLTRAEPFTAAERDQLEELGVRVAAETGAGVEVTTSADLTGPVALPEVGEVPMAATDAIARWQLVVVAAVFALMTAIATVSITAHDQRAASRRLEVLGATPGEIRGAVALHTGLLLGLSALLAGLATAGLAHTGLSEFNAARPGLAIPFRVPVPSMLVLVLAVPLVGAALAAAVVRQRPGPV